MMKQSKKGITLVELVICCAILVLLGGACTAVLVSGQTVFTTSSKTANAQLDADVLQTYLMNLLPPAKNIKEATSLSDVKDTAKEFNAIFFDSANDNVFTLRRGKDFTTIQSITGFQYNIVSAGEAASTSARAQLQYTITLTDGSEINGGFVLANVKYDASALPGAGTPVDLNGSAENFKAIIFDFEEPSTPEGGST